MNDAPSTETTPTSPTATPTETPMRGYKWVQNLMSKKWIQIPIYTPLCCDPGSETYWSM